MNAVDFSGETYTIIKIMARKKEVFETELKNLFIRPSRLSVSCSFEALSDELVTVPGKSQSVLQLYTDFVMGKLDPRQIGGSLQFDDPKSDEVDPFNSFGLSLEQVDALRQENERTIAQERKKGNRQTVANASTGTKQEEPQTPPPGSEQGSD